MTTVIPGSGVWHYYRRRAAGAVMEEIRLFNENFNYDHAEAVVDWSYNLIQRARGETGWVELTDEEKKAPEYPFFSLIIWPADPCEGLWCAYPSDASLALEEHCLIGVYDVGLKHRHCQCDSQFHSPAIQVVKRLENHHPRRR